MYGRVGPCDSGDYVAICDVIYKANSYGAGYVNYFYMQTHKDFYYLSEIPIRFIVLFNLDYTKCLIS